MIEAIYDFAHSGKTCKSGESECWIWTAGKNSKGYGIFHVNGRKRLAHRIAWMIHFGQIPTGIWVLHRCDVPACVNPAHLFLGTPKDNMADMIRKGRAKHSKGEQHPTAKLTLAQVKEIRAKYANGGCSHRSLGKEYHVSHMTIGGIVRGEYWK